MILGIVLHTCAAFSVYNYWLVTYVTPISWVDSVNEAIHFFRMPLFFIISGFFAFIILQKQTVVQFCQTKLLRVGIPFFVLLLIVNFPQYYLLENSLARHHELKVNLQANELTGHLWFLANLLIYFLLFGLFYKAIFLLKNRLDKWRGQSKRSQYIKAWILVALGALLAPLSFIFVLGLSKVGIPLYYPIPILGSLFIVFSHVDYFIFGIILAFIPHTRLLSFLRSKSGALVILFLFALGFLVFSFKYLFEPILSPYSIRLITLALCMTIMLICSSLLKSEATWMRKLAQASYTIYLFHHALVILFVLGLNSLAVHYGLILEPNFAFSLVLFCNLALTLLLHHGLIKRFKLTRLLFNGKP